MAEPVPYELAQLLDHLEPFARDQAWTAFVRANTPASRRLPRLRPVSGGSVIPRHQFVLCVSLLMAACADPAGLPAPESVSLARQSGDKSSILLTDLGTLGGKESRVVGLNTPDPTRQLLIVGESNDASGARLPAYWYVDVASGTKSIDRLKLPNGVSVPNHEGGVDYFDFRGGTTFDVNTNEQIVGYGVEYKNGTYNRQLPLFWSGPAAVPAFFPGLETRPALAGAINADGEAVGYLLSGTAEESVFFFDGAATTFLETLGGPGQPRDINNRGTIVGVSLESATSPFSSQRAFVSSASGPPMRLPDFGGQAGALAINDAGVIVGYALNAAGESRAVRWTGSIATGYVIKDLGLTRARAWDINSRGEIVGSFAGKRGERGFYQTAAGVTKELPILGYAGIAYAINENAEIVGISWLQSRYSHGVLWTRVR